MDISRKTDYALRILSELVNADGDVVSVRSVAEKHSIPYSFARSIQHDLARAGILASVRGSHGGMVLAIDPKTTSIRSVVEAIQGPIHMASCSVVNEGGPCPFREECHFNPLWCEAEHLLEVFFDSVSLYQVVVENKHPRLLESTQFELIEGQRRTDTFSGR